MNQITKILITGGSGFIGTNLIQYYIDRYYKVLNIDFTKPKDLNQLKYWKNIDINDEDKLISAVVDFNPDYIVHLAARTDLKGTSIEDYQANMLGVTNIINAANLCGQLKKLMITSSMLVCRTGYIPSNEFDYQPNTIYGESKVETEKITRNSKINSNWVIIRPSSIWGEYFGEPYKKYFQFIISGKYFHIGEKSCTKTYGYIGNSVYQIDRILFEENESINGNVFYIGDYEPYNIEEWSNEIASILGKRIIKLPFLVVILAAKFGDVLSKLKVNFPMTSFRLKNMTTDNILYLENTREVCPTLPLTRIQGVKKTLQWITSKQTI